MNRKNIIIFLVCTVVIIGLMVMNNGSSLATDAGWDVDYDYGSSSSSSSSGDMFYLIYLAIEHPLITLLVLSFFAIYILSQNSKKRKADGNNVDSLRNSMQDDETKALLFQAYQIFYETQMAWMNFDYDKLKTLVSDELYNNYYNQLEVLRMKNQRNIMRDFVLKNAQVLSKKVEGEQSTMVVSLNVSFYDYVIDCGTNAVVRGKDIQKVDMCYHITYVSSLKQNDYCPNCGAPLDTPNYCDYCKSHIQGLTSNMRISKKEVIQQKLE